jgi:phage terminase large subunit-like protein
MQSSAHDKLAHQYALDVISGKVPAGSWVVKSAQRHLDDLVKSKDKKYPYYFDSDKGAKVCRFIELLPHTKGKWASKSEKIVLQPWQCFIIVTLFGWLRKDNDKRRFRTAYFEIPRKNGKSIIAAGIGLYMLLADGEFGAEVYSGATTEKQAWEVFMPAKRMLEKTQDLLKYFGGEVWAKSLIVPKLNSKFEPVIGNPGDGASPSCAIVDEYHEHDTPILYDTMETGMGAREQPLMLVITTAGYNVAGACYEKHDELCKVLDKVIENDQFFGCIFGIDISDKWENPSSLIKANPNYGVSVDADFLQSQQRQAMLNPIQQNKFKTKHLNVWCSVMAGWMNMTHWELGKDDLLDESELFGQDCWIAIDLASKSDLCAEIRLYRKMYQGKPHYYLFGTYWLPEDAINDATPNHAHYQKWVKEGHLIQTDGATVDFELITDMIIDDCKRINPQEVIYDPFNATQMSQSISAEGIIAVEFTQNPMNFAVPMDEMLTAVKDGRLHHDGNPITTWCVSNVVARPTKKGLFAPMKQKPHQKIDGAVAAMMGMSRAIVETVPQVEPSIRWL